MVKFTRSHNWVMPSNHFPKQGDYRCRICDSRSGPFYDDDFGERGIDFLCHSCEDEIVEVRQVWAIEDSLKEQGL